MHRVFCAAGKRSTLTQRRKGRRDAKEEQKMNEAPCFSHPCTLRTVSLPLRVFASSRLCVFLFVVAFLVVPFGERPARADVTAAQVNAAIESGVAYLEKQQRPEGRW